MKEWHQMSYLKEKIIIIDNAGIGIEIENEEDAQEELEKLTNMYPEAGWRLLRIPTTEVEIKSKI